MPSKLVILILIISGLYGALEAKSTLKNSKPISSYLCTEEKCIMKCCEEGNYVTTILVPRPERRPGKKRTCGTLNNVTRNILNLDDENIFFNHPSFSQLNFTLKAGVFEANRTFRKDSVDIANLSNFKKNLTDYPKVLLDLPNAYYRWTEIPNHRFCWDYKIENATEVRNMTLKPGIWVLLEKDSDGPSRTNTDLLTSAMLISCFFLLIVLVVYGLLPELQNLCGMILMAYVASLFVAFLLLAAMRIKDHKSEVCLRLTYVIYFSFLASFCWMHVMSYDIWWTFRGYAKARPIHRRGEKFKFIMYCLYAFGLPLAMTIMLAVLNHLPLKHKPWIITPNVPANGCFIEGGEKMLYLYVPMLILIICNWLFYLMTAFNIWRLSRGTAVLDSAAAGTPQAHRTHLQRFMVYVKLSVVMGLNWVLEVVSYKYPGYSVWWITDFYNILIGVSIFLIFVCKRKILRKLVKEYLRCKSDHWRPGKDTSVRSSSTDSNSSNETQTLQICVNPRGPTYAMKPV